MRTSPSGRSDAVAPVREMELEAPAVENVSVTGSKRLEERRAAVGDQHVAERVDHRRGVQAAVELGL